MGIEEWQHLILSSLLAPPPNWFSVYLQSFKFLTAQMPPLKAGPCGHGWFWTCWNSGPSAQAVS